MTKHRASAARGWGTAAILRVLTCVLTSILSGGAALLGGLAAAQPAPRHEAPELAARVAAGRLPPLAQRLPARPLVIQPHERTGSYGGTWRAALRGTSDQSYLRVLVGHESLVRWNTTASGFVPNLAESWTVSPDARSYRFQLRQGLRWSDGAPFTTDDVLTWAWARERKLLPDGGRLALNSRRGPCTVAADGPLVLHINCPAPHGLVLDDLAGPNGYEIVSMPRHYMRRFVGGEAKPDELAALLSASRMPSWKELYTLRADPFMTPERPTLAPWLVVRPYTGTRVVFERNPYYWKLDPAGHQLPYLDRVAFDVAQDNEVLLLRALNGEFDFHARHFNTLANKAVVRKYRARGRYEMVERDSTDANYMAIWLNLTHLDPQRRALFNNKDLRIGLSHAIHRAEIIDLVFLDAGTPWQAAPRRESPYFHEQLATQYTAFDRNKAEAHFDRAGLKKTANGQRLGPDGQPLAIRVTVRADRPEMIATLQLVQKHWAAVGVRLDMEVIERSLFRQRYAANRHDAAADDVEAGGPDLLSNADSYAPVGPGSYFGVAWFNWLMNRRSDPSTSMEPPADAVRAFELNERAQEAVDPAERVQRVKELLDIAAERFWGIGIAAPSDFYGIVSQRMRNVPRRQIDSYSLGFPGPYAPEQFFIER